MSAPTSQGKVRDIYDLGSEVVLVATDRISAFDVILPKDIPHKGQVLTQLSRFWFNRTAHIVGNHMISSDADAVLAALREAGTAVSYPGEPDGSWEGADPAEATLEDMRADEGRAAVAAFKAELWLDGRAMLCRKAEVIPVECVARGYLAGSGWSEYQRSQTVCGVKLQPGLKESSRLSEPIFTPTTKATTGHDEAIDFGEVARQVGGTVAAQLREKTIELYTFAHAYALERGIIIADTKFEFGMIDGALRLIDEALTPDSSRFWPADEHEPGRPQASFDKQFVRDWLDASGWDHEPPPPDLPGDVIAKTAAKYIEAFVRLTGEDFEYSET
jgi:phosphoribosylaminoimidazole-succinocarboxamide synthase